jgi:hypothetical protein
MNKGIKQPDVLYGTIVELLVVTYSKVDTMRVVEGTFNHTISSHPRYPDSHELCRLNSESGCGCNATPEPRKEVFTWSVTSIASSLVIQWSPSLIKKWIVSFPVAKRGSVRKGI